MTETRFINYFEEYSEKRRQVRVPLEALGFPEKEIEAILKGINPVTDSTSKSGHIAINEDVVELPTDPAWHATQDVLSKE
jgi:hypothetical protein